MISLDKVCKVTVGAKQTTPMLSKVGSKDTQNHLLLSSLNRNQIEDHDLYKNLKTMKAAMTRIDGRTKGVDLLADNEETIFQKLDSKAAYAKLMH